MWMRCLSAITFCFALTGSAQTLPGSAPIVVWKVGSPHLGDTPDTTVPLDLKLRAEKIGDEIRIEAFPAAGFAQFFFDAFERKQEPDIVSFDNRGILDGIATQLGGFTGIGSSPTVRKSLVEVTGSLEDLGRGWQFLVSTSKNHKAARTLALPSPQCDTSYSPTPVSFEIQTIAERMSSAFLEQAASLKAYADNDRLLAEGARRDPVQVTGTRACGVWGSDKLAFVSLLSTYESPRVIGQIPVLLVLRKPDAEWRLLAASTDPISNSNFLKQIPRITGLLQNVRDAPDKPEPAQLQSPGDGQEPLPETGQRFGSFSWSPSPSENVVAEIAEFAYLGDARLFLKLRTKQQTTERISAGELWNSRTEWNWRVWSISDTGTLALSKPRSFLH